MESPAVRKGRSWWNGITKAVLTAGALATAVGAFLALRPAPDAQDGARFLSVRVTSEVPFSEYRQRALTLAPRGDAWGAQQPQPPATRLVADTMSSEEPNPAVGPTSLPPTTLST
jgi:hypothetical protein